VILRAALVMVLAAGPAWAEQAPASPTPANPHDATARHPFTGVEKWKKIFDDPKRDGWQKPKETVAGLDLKPGQIVADLGAGTGYFERHLSKAVAPGGIVLAIDSEPEMVQHLGRRALEEQTPNVVPVLALPDEPFLPPGRVDCVLIVDTYHHIPNREAYFRRLRKSMKPSARLAIIDFRKGAPPGPPEEFRFTPDQISAELGKAGLTLQTQHDFLPRQIFLVYHAR